MESTVGKALDEDVEDDDVNVVVTSPFELGWLGLLPSGPGGVGGGVTPGGSAPPPNGTRLLLAGIRVIILDQHVLHTRPPIPMIRGTTTTAPSLPVLVEVIVVVVVREVNLVTVDGTNYLGSVFHAPFEIGLSLHTVTVTTLPDESVSVKTVDLEGGAVMTGSGPLIPLSGKT